MAEDRTRVAQPSNGRVDDKGAIPPVGSVIAGKYRVERLLGFGGMGCVIAARHLTLNKDVAIKFLLPELAMKADASVRFLREARAATSMTSENVVRVTDAGTLPDGRPYMVMELLAGSDLGQQIDTRGAFPIAEAVQLVMQACAAIAEAHSLGIVHRDLKPANLFLTHRSDGTPLVKVLDFGISKAIGGSGAELELTNTGDVFGSPKYMSPEQVRDTKSVDLRTDIWALGVVLYELLSGGPLPFDASTGHAMLAKIVADAPAPLRAHRPDVPGALEAAINKCLEKNPANRFASVAAFASAIAPFGDPATAPLLEKYIVSSSSPARKTPTLGSVGYDELPALGSGESTTLAYVPPVDAAAAPTGSPWAGAVSKPPRRSALPLLLLGGVGLLVIGAVGTTVIARQTRATADTGSAAMTTRSASTTEASTATAVLGGVATISPFISAPAASSAPTSASPPQPLVAIRKAPPSTIPAAPRPRAATSQATTPPSTNPTDGRLD